jgi:phage antirepressor YoqD-like protein
VSEHWITLYYKDNSVLTVIKDDERWWVGKDVGNILGIKSIAQAIVPPRLKSGEAGVIKIPVSEKAGSNRRIVLSDTGLFRLLGLYSDNPEALGFINWVRFGTPAMIKCKNETPSESDKIDYALVKLDKILTLLPQTNKQHLTLEIVKAEPAVVTKKDIPRKQFMATNKAIPIREYSKRLKANGVPVNANYLYAYMRDTGHLFTSGPDRNRPVEKSINAGLFSTCKTNVRENNADIYSIMTTVTPKGQKYFYEQLSSKFQ